MYRSLLVPLDGSAFGAHALPLALLLAQKCGAAIELVHVHVDLFRDVQLYPVGTDAADTRTAEQVYLDRVAAQIRPSVPAGVTTALLEGPVPMALAAHATARNADLIVMTTHGRGPLSRFWLGSVADQIIRHSAVPLLLIRPQEGGVDLTRLPAIRHVLIPLDGSELAETILEPATALGCAVEADFTLFSVVEPVVPFYDPPSHQAGGGSPGLVQRLQRLHEEIETEGLAYLERVAERFRSPSRTVHTRIVFSDQPAVAILDEAREAPMDLIALETHGRGGLSRLLLGSVADKVLRGATAPMLIHRPSGQ